MIETLLGQWLNKPCRTTRHCTLSGLDTLNVCTGIDEVARLRRPIGELISHKTGGLGHRAAGRLGRE